MKKILLTACFAACTLTFVNAQTVNPSPIRMSDLAEQQQLIPPPTFARIGNKTSEESESMRLEFPMPSNARKMYQAIANRPGNPANSVTSASPNFLNSFIGLNDNATIIPPDVNGAAGANHLIVTHNSEFRITDKVNNQVVKISATAFWTGASPSGLSDPHVIYNHYLNKWIMIGQSDATASSSVLVAVSQTSDPLGVWYRYAIDIDAGNTNFFDYPLIGYNQNWLVVAGNVFNIAASTNQGSQIYIFDMATLASGGSITLGTNAQRISNSTAQGGTLAPVTVYETGVPSNTMYLLQNWNGGAKAIRMTTLTGTIPSVVFGSAVFPIGPTAWASSAGVTNNNSSPQLDEARKINSGDARMAAPVMVNGKIWAAHHVFLPSVSPTRAAIQWWQLQTDGTILQNGLIDDGVPEVHRTYPTIAVTGNDQVLIGYSKSTTAQYVTAAYSYRDNNTPLNTMNDEVEYKKGLSTYWKDFGAGRCRWGDYSSTCLDPVSGRFWTLQEIANTRVGATDADSRWASWWAEVAPIQAPNAVYFVNAGIIESETGNTGTCPKYHDVTIPFGINGSATGSATVTITGSGTATAGTDYQILTPSLSYTAADNATKNITLRIFDDAAVESQETITLAYSISGSGVVAGSTGVITTISITDNDVVPATGTVTVSAIGTLGTQLGNSSIFKGATASQEKMQNLYTASELTAAGFAAGTFTTLGYYFVTTTPTQYTNFTIKMANVSATGLTVGSLLTPTFTTVYSGNYTTPAVGGWSDVPLTGTFVWDGISNVLIETCYENPSLNTDILILGTAPGGTPTVFNRQTTGAGCSLTTSTSSSTFHPDIRLSETLVGTVPETALNSSVTVPFGPNEEVYVYNGSKVIAGIKNLSSFDYGCTQFIIDRQGTSANQFWNNNPSNYLFSKTLRIIPANNTATGNFQVTMYYTNAEVTGWQTATGQSISSVQMAHITNGHYIPDVTPATPYSADVLVVTTTQATYGTGYKVTGTYPSSQVSGGFGIGVPAVPVPVTLVSFTGYLKDKQSVLNWTTATEANNKGFELEKSFDGSNFSKIAFVSGAGTSAITHNYLYTDKSKLANIQYYRLKQVDFDGRYNYSNIVAIRPSDKMELDVISVSNPFRDNIRIQFSIPPSNKVNFEIYDAAGKRVAEYNQLIYSNNATVPVPVNLSKGTYVLRILVNDLVFNEQLIRK